MNALIEAWDTAVGVDNATQLFVRVYGAAPHGVWTAPGRVNLIGEHVDYNGGICLPMALPHRNYVAFARRDDDVVRFVSIEKPDAVWTGTLADIRPGGDFPSWIGYAGGPFWALAQEPDLTAKLTNGFDVAIATCVPLGAGLSSSAALECAMAMAIDDEFGLGLASTPEGRSRIAAAGVRAENEVAGAATGGMDQAAAVHATEAHALLLDCLDGTFRQVPFDLASRGLSLLVVDTMAHHSLADGQYGKRRAVCETVAEREGVPTLRELPNPEETMARLDDSIEYARVKHVVTEIERVRESVEALEQGNFTRLGELFFASHASLRDDYEVSAPELDLVVELAQTHKALGARMTGGGFGGSAIVLLFVDHVEEFMNVVTAAYEERGWTLPRFIEARASAGAERVA